MTRWHVVVALQDISMSGCGGGMIRIGGWGARKENVLPIGVLVGAVLKLEFVLVFKVNDGVGGVVRRLGSVHVVNGHDALVALA